ncbi:MAG: ABC transporter transmembrane domain-containing protein, partial [Eubacterium sp.]|nr:ABC transporter transmembrane domain-containing protein [Eubacterium sp.]
MADARKTVAPGPPGRRGRQMQMQGGKPKNSGATIRRLAGYLKTKWYLLLIAMILVLLSSVSSVLGSYILKPIMNQIAESAQAVASATGDVAPLIEEGVSKLFGMLLMATGIYAISILATYFQMRIMLSVAQDALIRVRKDLFDHLQKMPVRYFDTNTTGDIMSRFTNDVDAIGEMLSQTLLQLFSGIINIVGILVIMLTESVWLSLVT